MAATTNLRILFAALLFGLFSAGLHAQITQGEYFWDTDPGPGNGIAVTAADGTFDQVYEAIVMSNAPAPLNGVHRLGIRLKDVNNNWGPVFSIAVAMQNAVVPPLVTRTSRVLQAEAYWDVDPGAGNGIPFLAADGSFDSELESITQTLSTAALSNGTHALFLRLKDYDNHWGPAFGVAVAIQNPVTPVLVTRPSRILQAEAYWDTDPGAGNGIPFLASDGNFDAETEAISQSVMTNTLTTGPHALFIRLKDVNNNWGPVFGVAVFANPSLVPVITNVNGAQTVCSNQLNGQVYFITNHPGNTYSWNITGGTIVSGQTTSSVMVDWNAVGPYSLSATECNANGCSNPYVITITVSAAPSANFSGLSSSYCSNDPVVTLTGAPAGGTFSGPGISGAQFNPSIALAGTHTIVYTYSDGTCSATAAQSVTVNAAPVVSFSGLGSAYCTSDAAVTLTGAPAGGTFSGPGCSGTQFDPALAGAGTFTITYTYSDGTCTASNAQNVTVGTPVIASFTGLPSAVCAAATPIPLTGIPSGGTFTGPGMSGSTFDPSVSGSGTFTITYTVTNGGCSASYQQAITVWPLPAVPVITQTANTLFSDAASGNQWYDGVGAIPGETAQSFSPLQNGTYYVIVTDSNGCSSTSQPYAFIGTGVATNITGSLNVFPDPATDEIFISFGTPVENARLILLDVSGREVRSLQLDGNHSGCRLDLATVPAGAYLLRVETGTGVQVRRIVRR